MVAAGDVEVGAVLGVLAHRLVERRDAEGIRAIPGGEVLNDVVFTQVCARFGGDQHTREVVRRMLADGTAWTSGSKWHDHAVLRVALCNWSTTDDDVEATLAALRRAAV